MWQLLILIKTCVFEIKQATILLIKILVQFFVVVVVESPPPLQTRGEWSRVRGIRGRLHRDCLRKQQKGTRECRTENCRPGNGMRWCKPPHLIQPENWDDTFLRDFTDLPKFSYMADKIRLVPVVWYLCVKLGKRMSIAAYLATIGNTILKLFSLGG